MASPPKPWERPGAPATSATLSSSAQSIPALSSGATASNALAPTAANPSPSSSDSSTPAIPARPPSLASTVNQNASAYSRYGSAYGSAYGASPFGTYGSAYSAPYSSPYSRYGGYGSMYGGMGGYGGGMGGYGGGMYGGGMYPGAPGGGMPGDPNNPDSLTNRFNVSTQATFQMLEGIVGAFGGLAQMLESTYMATHSSFFAMIAVAEQFGNLRETLGRVLGIFTLMRWIRTLIAKLTGRPPPVDAMALTPAAFARFEGRQHAAADGGPPKPNRKPLFFFLLAAFGLPYVMNKVIRAMASNVEEEERRRQALQQAQQQPFDPSKLEFCRVLYDYSAAAQGAAVVSGVDLDVKKGDLVAVLGKTDPLGQPSQWWRCRARDGRIGYLPANFLEVLRRPAAAPGTAAPLAIKGVTGGSAATVTDGTGSERADSLTSAVSAPPVVMPTSKPGDISVESFQKAAHFHP